MNMAHIHLLLNHFPIIGTLIAIGLLLIGMVAKSNDLKRASLAALVGIALITIPVYVSGSAAQDKICGWAPLTQRGEMCRASGVTNAMLDEHEGAALLAFVWMMLVGAIAWLGLWQFRRLSRLPGRTLAAILILSAGTFALMVRAGNLGGQISHVEVRDAPDTAAAPPADKPLARRLGSAVINDTWIWPTSETVHFIGLSLLFGVAALIDLRVLGMMKSVPFSALHRLLPWGILGFGLNLITGMAFFIGAPGQYTQNPTFHWKMALIVLGGLNMLYFTLFDEPWALGSGDDAPVSSKAFAWSALVLVVCVLYCGRMLPFIGNAF